MNTRESGLVQQNVGRLCWYRGYYRSTLEVVLVQQSTIGAI